ncbi:MAG: SDR family NAD(P)-dependent oxidoreductase [Deltaproteobacteria bacterium]|nr:SDR family NAD(P)-dependent oxidoreductase [Deltaproteobacteria bacterium]
MSEFGFSSTAEDVTEGVSLEGKTILITGCNSGIGLESARVLAKRGAHIIGLARSVEKAEAALSSVGINGTAVACDLSEPKEVLKSVQTVLALAKKIDVLLCNAGIMALPERQEKYGLELQFLTNHMGHFLLVTGLVDALTKNGRVVMLSSGAHFMADKEIGIDFDDLGGENYEPWKQYGQSKLANLLFARSLAKQFSEDKGNKRSANAVHPGVIRTNLTRHIGGEVFDSMDQTSIKTIAQGAATQCFVAVQPRGGQLSGTYFSDCHEAKCSKWGKDDALAERLWKKSEELAASF